MGGYVCAPVLFVAKKLLDIPVFIHESNSIAGKTNKFIGKFADGIALGFESTKKEFRSKFVFVTGNPVSQEFFNIKKKTEDNNTILAFGGSQGAKAINDAVVDLINNYKFNYKIIYATGEKNYEIVKSSIKDLSKVELLPYINNMPHMYERVSLVVARAGALTISELIAADMPAILIPLPTAAENHQEYNARAFEDMGNGIMLLEKDLTAKKLNTLIEKMLKEKHKENRVKKENADEKIFKIIQPYLEK
jgi:UDP-N-acetylglucosamine--N-acetylmuramyl-(pentapeptide) pyrophosphoryl-undecaprenol N-acetylglucosamine transferase